MRWNEIPKDVCHVFVWAVKAIAKPKPCFQPVSVSQIWRAQNDVRCSRSECSRYLERTQFSVDYWLYFQMTWWAYSGLSTVALLPPSGCKNALEHRQSSANLTWRLPYEAHLVHCTATKKCTRAAIRIAYADGAISACSRQKASYCCRSCNIS